MTCETSRRGRRLRNKLADCRILKICIRSVNYYSDSCTQRMFYAMRFWIVSTEGDGIPFRNKEFVAKVYLPSIRVGDEK